MRCVQDVVYAAANMKAMSFIGGGAKNFQDFFEFLGMVKDKRVPPAGSPFQMNFPGESKTPRGMTPANESVPACWESALKCSCGDCPDGPQCSPVSPLPHADCVCLRSLLSVSMLPTGAYLHCQTHDYFSYKHLVMCSFAAPCATTATSDWVHSSGHVP